MPSGMPGRVAGPGCSAVRARRGRERARSSAWPVSGERGIQHSGQAAGVRQPWVAILRPGERRENPQAGRPGSPARAAPKEGRAEHRPSSPARCAKDSESAATKITGPPGSDRAGRRESGQETTDGHPVTMNEGSTRSSASKIRASRGSLTRPAARAARHDLGHVRSRRQDASATVRASIASVARHSAEPSCSRSSSQGGTGPPAACPDRRLVRTRWRVAVVSSGRAADPGGTRPSPLAPPTVIGRRDDHNILLIDRQRPGHYTSASLARAVYFVTQ